MHTVPIEQAPSQITQLLAEAMAGEEVVFTRELKPVVRLSSIPESNGISDEQWLREIRALRGIFQGMDTTVTREPDREF